VDIQADTIVALCTPPGRSAIGVIRLSGSDSLKILRELIASPSFNPQPNLLTLRSLFDPSSGDVLDRALICFFAAPHSFTGEDVVELHCHGSPVLLQSIIDIILKRHARLADPGEFSLRAVRNGRLQLTEAEAIRDLVDAQTDAAVKQATRQLKGEISNTLQPAKEQLLKVIVRLESSIEFVEEDLPSVEHDDLTGELQAIQNDLSRLRETFAAGKLLRDGLKAAFIGRPNVGKSSLFNRLLGRGRAIVTDIPGTTRDTLTEPLGIHGVPVLLIDTAGIRESIDEIESIGVERTKREAADADILIVVVDGSAHLQDEDRDVLSEVENQLHLVALNKSDLESFSASRAESDISVGANCVGILSVSAKTEVGLETLRAAILKPFLDGRSQSDGLLITNARHHDLLTRTIAALQTSESLMHERVSEELVLVGLHNALRFLDELTGETTSDDILGQIFSTFCIGK
jgi:tRNA modification GTPase